MGSFSKDFGIRIEDGWGVFRSCLAIGALPSQVVQPGKRVLLLEVLGIREGGERDG